MYAAKFNFEDFFSITFSFFSTITSAFYSSSSLDEDDEQEHEDEDPLEFSNFKEGVGGKSTDCSPYAVYASSFGVAGS